MEIKEKELKISALYSEYQKLIEEKNERDKINVLIYQKHDALKKAEDDYAEIRLMQLKHNFPYKEGEKVILTKEVFEKDNRVYVEKHILLISSVLPVLIRQMIPTSEGYNVDYDADLFDVKLVETYNHNDRFGNPYHPGVVDVTFCKDGAIHSPWCTINSENNIRRLVSIEKTEADTI